MYLTNLLNVLNSLSIFSFVFFKPLMISSFENNLSSLIILSLFKKYFSSLFFFWLNIGDELSINAFFLHKSITLLSSLSMLKFNFSSVIISIPFLLSRFLKEVLYKKTLVKVALLKLVFVRLQFLNSTFLK